LVSGLEELKHASCASKNWRNIEASEAKRGWKATTENLRKGIPPVWRETFENGIPGGKCYSL